MRSLVLLSLALFSTVAHAYDEVGIDCESDVSNSNTDDDVRVLMWADTYLHTIRTDTTEWCGINTWFDTLGGKDLMVTHFNLEATGDDALLIDEFHFGDKTTDTDYCLSTDTTDSFTQGTSTTSCHHTLYVVPRMGAGSAYAYVPSAQEETVWTVRVNTWNGNVSSEDTNDTITATFYDGSVAVGSADLVYAYSGEYGVTIRQSELSVSDAVVDRVKFSTTGTDAMFLDLVRLKRYEPGDAGYTNIGSWGVDGGNGWCLSNQASDGTGSWSSYLASMSTGKCNRALQFTAGSSTVASWAAQY